MAGKSIAEHLADLKATREATEKRQNAIAQKAMDEGRGLNDAERAEDDTIEAEIKELDDNIERFTRMESRAKASAAPVDKEIAAKAGAPAGASASGLRVEAKEVQAKDGLAVAQLAKAIARAQGNYSGALEIVKSQSGSVDKRVENVLKAAVAAGSTSNTTWVGNLVGDETSVYADFLEYLRPRTLIGNIPGLRRIPFRVPLVGQTSGGAGYWVGEGQAKPLTKFDFSRTTLEPLKVANIAVLTEEAIRDSSPAADVIVRDQLVAALRERLDLDFINPAKSASAGVSPASILNGVTPVTGSGGTEAADVRCDIQALYASFIAANNAPTAGVFIMNSTTALALSLMVNPLGQPEFGGISMNGGNFFGLPVVVSDYVPSGVVALVNASDIYIADDGGFSVDLSREASLQMDDSPDNPTSATTVLVSLWQRNLVGFRAERAINWARRRDSAVAYLTGVNWGACGS